MLHAMAEIDPFGRAADEDPIADMGWSTTGVTTMPQAADVAAPDRPDHAARRALRTGDHPAPTAGIPGDKRRRGNAGCAFAVVVLGFIVAVSAVVVPTALESVDEVRDAIPTVPAIPTPAEPSRPSDRERPAKPSRPPRGLERASLLRRGNLVPALRRLRRATKASRVHLIRIDAETALVTVPVGRDRTRVAQATWDDEANVLSTSPGRGGGTSFTWSQIDASAPNRIVRAATRGRSSRSFDYLVLLDSSGLRWSAFLKGGGIYSAAPDGSAVTRVGG
jgi:hypothetical protein